MSLVRCTIHHIYATGCMCVYIYIYILYIYIYYIYIHILYISYPTILEGYYVFRGGTCCVCVYLANVHVS